MVSETGAGTVGVVEALMATVAVTAVGAVHAMAVQLQVVGLRVTTILVLDPELELQLARVVLIVKVATT